MYLPYEYGNDIMILKLQQSSNHTYTKIASPATTFQDGQRFSVIGFGDTVASVSVTSLSLDLLETEVEYVNQTRCQQLYLYGTIDDNMMCAAKTNKDACTGDSGGPLILKGDSPENDEVVGTVSWGRGCAIEDYPGVYARMSYFFDWIQAAICHHSASPPEYMACDVQPVNYHLLANGCNSPSPATSSAPTTPAPTFEPTVSPSNKK